MTSAGKGYVIRSMSTTDYNGRDPVTPYHVYLKPALMRGRAFWTTSIFERETYPTLEAAQAEIARCALGAAQVAPADDRGFPTYWALQNATEEAKVEAVIAHMTGAAK